MNNTNIAENHAKNTVESTDKFATENINSSVVDDGSELQLLDVDDIEDDLQIEEYTDAIDANDFLFKLS